MFWESSRFAEVSPRFIGVFSGILRRQRPMFPRDSVLSGQEPLRKITGSTQDSS